MATVLSISDTIDVGRVSTYLSLNYVDKQRLFGGAVIKPTPPTLIGMATDGLEWGVGSQTDESLRNTAGYAYWLYGKFQLQAQYIISGPGGGSVSPTPSGGGTVNDLDFIVSATSIIPTGGTSIFFDGTSGNPDFRGMNVNFARNGTTQYTTPQSGQVYYGWNKVTGQFQLLSTDSVGNPPNALEGESFRIMPDSGSASSSSAASVAPSITVLPAAWASARVLNLQYIVDAGEVALFVSGYNSNFLIAPTDFTYTAGGIEMVDINFNKDNFPFTLIMKIN